MKLETYLKKHDKTHEAFASEISVSAASVSRYVAGGRIPTLDIMERIRTATRGAVTANDFYHAALPAKPRKPLEART